MLSIKYELKFIIQRAILTAFPIKEEPIVHPSFITKDLFNYDYICYSPKFLFDKYKHSDSFYGLSNEKAVAEDIRVQIPDNPIISRVDVTNNGGLHIKLDDEFIKAKMKAYESFIIPKETKKGLICLPSVTNGQKVDYEFFRAINIAEKLQRLMTRLKYQSKVVFPIIDQVSLPDNVLARSFLIKNYENMLKNEYFDVDHDILLSSDMAGSFDGFFKGFSQDFDESRREKYDLTMYNLSLLSHFLKAKYKDQQKLVIMAPSSEALSLKKTLKSFLKDNKQVSNSYKAISEFYYGRLLFENSGKFKSDAFIMEDLDDPKFSRIVDFTAHIDKTIQKPLQEIQSLTGKKLKTEEILKALDVYMPIRSTHSISEAMVDHFLTNTFSMIIETYRLLMIERSKYKSQKVPMESLDDFGRIIAVKLLRYNEVIEEMFSQGDVGRVLHYWEDLAIAWYTIFNTSAIEQLGNKTVLLENTLMVYDQFLHVFFGSQDK